jgi:hypothetical protein
MDLPDSNQVSRAWFYSGTHRETTHCRVRDCHPLRFRFPSDSASKLFCNSTMMAPRPRKAEALQFRLSSFSLAATGEVAVAFLSCGYLDVSVDRVGLVHLWIGCTIIRESRDQRLLDGFPELFAAFHALHRLLAPRHPPHALSSLTTMIIGSCRARSRHETPPRHARQNILLPWPDSPFRGPLRPCNSPCSKSFYSDTLDTIPCKVHIVLARNACIAHREKMPLLPLPNCQRTKPQKTQPLG